jgi:hypothetical protein
MDELEETSVNNVGIAGMTEIRMIDGFALSRSVALEMTSPTFIFVPTVRFSRPPCLLPLRPLDQQPRL